MYLEDRVKGFAVRSDLGCEGKRRINEDTTVFSLSK